MPPPSHLEMEWLDGKEMPILREPLETETGTVPVRAVAYGLSPEDAEELMQKIENWSSEFRPGVYNGSCSLSECQRWRDGHVKAKGGESLISQGFSLLTGTISAAQNLLTGRPEPPLPLRQWEVVALKQLRTVLLHDPADWLSIMQVSDSDRDRVMARYGDFNIETAPGSCQHGGLKKQPNLKPANNLLAAASSCVGNPATYALSRTHEDNLLLACGILGAHNKEWEIFGPDGHKARNHYPESAAKLAYLVRLRGNRLRKLSKVEAMIYGGSAGLAWSAPMSQVTIHDSLSCGALQLMNGIVDYPLDMKAGLRTCYSLAVENPTCGARAQALQYIMDGLTNEIACGNLTIAGIHLLTFQYVMMDPRKRLYTLLKQPVPWRNGDRKKLTALAERTATVWAGRTHDCYASKLYEKLLGQLEATGTVDMDEKIAREANVFGMCTCYEGVKLRTEFWLFLVMMQDRFAQWACAFCE